MKSLLLYKDFKTKSPIHHLIKTFHTLHLPQQSVKVPSQFSPTYLNFLLNNATQTKNIKHATQIHTQLITQNHISLPFLFNNLLNLYSKCGQIIQSLTLFSTHFLKTDKDNVITWTSMVTQLSHNNKPYKALDLFNEMRRVGVSPNHFTFSALLPCCASTFLMFHGEQVHSLVFKSGFQFDVFVSSALVDMYAKCGDMKFAKKMFDEMVERNLVSWNSMIVGYLQNGIFDEAIGFFVKVLGGGLVKPDQVSFSSFFSACANVCGLEIGRQGHGVAIKHGVVALAYVKNSIMDMYSKCGLFDDADRLFRSLGGRDVVTWNVMIMGCVQNDNFEQACNYFWVMRRQGVSPDEASFSSALHAAACIAALDQGTLIHDQIIKTGFERNICVASSLITMYAKCGCLHDALQVFRGSEDRNVVSWTAMISACQQHGCANQVIELFEDMLREGIKPDYITFVCVLSACSHTGRVNEGFSYFNSMTQRHNMSPGPEHYASMVDLLGRAGRLQEAKRFVDAMPISPDASVWGALLGACRKYGDVEMGREVAQRLFEIEPDNPGNYMLLCNMYARTGKLQEADEVRRLMGVNLVRKEPGCSWIDVKNTTHVFTAHDRSHSMTTEIYEMLEKVEDLVKQKGYGTQSQDVVNNENEYKYKNLWHHSERLALAFGLLILPVGAPIRIKKNLRTCVDCHTVMKFASDALKREIIVRDINRFHRFVDGFCSCGDYW